MLERRYVILKLPFSLGFEILYFYHCVDVKLHILLKKPTEGVDFGIQKGAGSKYETIQTKRSDGKGIQFDLTIQLKNAMREGDRPLFKGPVVQGKPDFQFIYIDVGAFAGQVGGWSRRMKIPLYSITWDVMVQLNSRPGSFLTTQIPGSREDGSPNCATIKPFDGWKVNVAPK